jgi:uncharacterized protein
MRRRPFRLILAVFVVLAVYCVLIEPAMIGYTTHEIPVKGLPRSFDGFKIVQITDVHLNIWTSPARVRAIVRRVNAMHPDLVVLTGDYVSFAKSNCVPSAKALGGLRAKHGVYAVLGNHDYWTDAPLMTRALRDQGIPVLFDEQRTITIGKERIQLVGTNDVWEGHPDYKKAFKDVSSREPCICIAHNPDAVLFMKGRRVDLLLSGHTHGGLINMPFIGPLCTISHVGRKNSMGMFTMNGVRTYVSRGIGTGNFSHIRFRCPPEVPVFVLHCAE